MQDLINLSMLVCAVFASLAFGVFSAQAVCRAAFAILKAHAASVAGSELEKASATS